MSDRRDALYDLLKHPGWALFAEHVVSEWGPTGSQYTKQLESALNEDDPDHALSKSRQVVAGRKIVDLLLKWPSEELSRLDRSEDSPLAALSRGGYR